MQWGRGSTLRAAIKPPQSCSSCSCSCRKAKLLRTSFKFEVKKSREKNVTGNKSFARVTRQAAEAKVARWWTAARRGRGKRRKGGWSHVAARLETSQFKRLRSRPLAATERDCKTLRMRNIYAFIFVSARNQIYIFGPLKLIIILPHTKTAFTDKGRQQVGVRVGERERENAMNTKCGAAFGFGFGFAAQRQLFPHWMCW